MPTAQAGNGRKYFLGEKDGKDIAIVWREYKDKWSDKDLKRDKEFIISELENWAPPPKNFEVRYTELEFKKLMGR